MTTKKYRSYGVRRENNLADLDNKEEGLNNLLNNMPGVGGDISFTSQDLDAIRGLKDTAINASDFVGLAGSTPRVTEVDEDGVQLVDSSGDPSLVIIKPIYRIEDRIRSYRKVTENPPVFVSGTGPYAYTIPSGIIPALSKGANLNSINISAIQASNATLKSDDFWALGEFSISNKFNINFPNEYGGILWEGYYIPDPITSTHTFTYDTTGLFHVEYDRFGNNTWEVVKSIYAKQRVVTVDAAVTAATVIQLAPGDARFVSNNDFILGDPTNFVTSVNINNDTVALTNPITRALNSTITFDMDLGKSQYDGSYIINEILDRAETPQIKKRIFWWYPFDTSYSPDIKYLRNRLLSPGIARTAFYSYFNWNKERSSNIAAPGSIRDVLNTSITPSQDNFGSAGNEKFFRSNLFTDTIYTPKSSFAEINKGTTTVSFESGSRYIIGSLTFSAIGNAVVPAAVAAIPSETFNLIPKNLRIKTLLGVGVDSTARIVDLPTPVTGSASVNIIDHLGLIDYFVASSVGDLVTVSSAENLKKDMICITATTSAIAYVRITEVLAAAPGVTPTQFRTSVPLNLTDGFVYVYSNSGIVDRSMETFCSGVFGQAVQTTTAEITNTIQLVSIAGVVENQVVQFGSAIPALPPTTVTAIDIATNTITLSAATAESITQGETIVFAPAGTATNKEICVLPLDLSPPFIGVTTGLSTDGKSIKSAQTQPLLNVRTNTLTFKTATATAATITETYDRRISIKNINPLTGTAFTILSKLVI